MVSFSLFRLHDELGDFDSFVALDEKRGISISDPIDRGDFTAKLYFKDSSRRQPQWLSFIDEGFPTALNWPNPRSVSALLVVNANPNGPGQYFALAFGQAGRFMIRKTAYRRRYGLLTALNLLTAGSSPPRIRGLQTTRHTESILRSRLETTSPSSIGTFELDVLRDLLRGATGTPTQIKRWGRRVAGADSFRMGPDIPFAELGNLCREVEAFAEAKTYLDYFPWIDNIQAVTDDSEVSSLEQEVVGLLRVDASTQFHLAPPELVEWNNLSGFQYHFDTRIQPPLVRNDLMLDAYLEGLCLKDPELEKLDSYTLQRRSIFGFDDDGGRPYEWSVWQCLVGEFTCKDQTFIIEDGSFYRISDNYLEQLNEDVNSLGVPSGFLPSARPKESEADYNQRVAETESCILLTDAKLVYPEGGKVELCDLLTDRQQFIHVKIYGKSEKMSHLFSQARVSSEALLRDRTFRADAQRMIAKQSRRDPRFDFIRPGIQPDTGEFEVVLAIIKNWRAENLDSLPFFAKIELRKVATDLQGRGYKVAVQRVPIE